MMLAALAAYFPYGSLLARRRQRRDCRPVDRAFAMFEVIRDHLFDRPARCAIHLLCGAFDMLAGDFVKCHTNCGSAHAFPAPT
jgi:hypothetical protein